MAWDGAEGQVWQVPGCLYPRLPHTSDQFPRPICWGLALSPQSPFPHMLEDLGVNMDLPLDIS